MLCVQADSTSAGIDLGPDQAQQSKPGQDVLYHHVLTNTGTTTDTFSVDARSTQGWPLALSSEAHPAQTHTLTFELGTQVSSTFELSLTVPLCTGGVTEVTFITATSHLSPTVRDTATDTTSVPATVYLPLLFQRWPPLPYQPTLNPIANPDGDGAFTVSWTELPTRLADTYVVEEATDSSFSNDLRPVSYTHLRAHET